jgi:predicted GTPase
LAHRAHAQSSVRRHPEPRERFTARSTTPPRAPARAPRAHSCARWRAAIDLYGATVIQQTAWVRTPAATRRDIASFDERGNEPIRILVAGQGGAGKSSLVNALANAVEAAVNTVPTTAAFTAYTLTHEGLPAALLIDSPGLAGPDNIAALVEAADDCDMVLWVASAVQAARESDRSAMQAIRAHFRAMQHRRQPPMLLVLTQIDRLRPFGEWDPPYDLGSPTRSKAVSIRAAIEAAAAELDFAADDIVPVRIDLAVAPYNVDTLWAKIIELAPDAQRARLLRSLSDIKSAAGWGTIWSQAVNAGRVIRGINFVLARSTELRGRVTDAQTGRPIEGAQIVPATTRHASDGRCQDQRQERCDGAAGRFRLRMSQIAVIGLFVIALLWAAYGPAVVVPVVLA